MFMFSFRLKKKKLLIASAILLVMAFAAMGTASLFGSNDAIATGGNVQEPQRPSRVRTNEQRLEYIASFAWIVEPEPVEIIEIIIPAQFDALYEEYNAMQKQAGYDLSKHAGRRGKRYTYVVTNYPGVDQDVRLNLLVRDNRVIGGDVYATGPNGFMHGLCCFPDGSTSSPPV